MDKINKIMEENAELLDRLANGPKHLQKELTLSGWSILEQVGPFVTKDQIEQILKGLGFIND